MIRETQHSRFVTFPDGEGTTRDRNRKAQRQNSSATAAASAVDNKNKGSPTTCNGSHNETVSQFKRLSSTIKKRGNKTSVCPLPFHETRNDDFTKRAKNVKSSEVVTRDLESRNLSTRAASQRTHVLTKNVQECNIRKYTTATRFTGDIPQCWLRESCLQLMDICEEMSYIEFLKPFQVPSHVNEKERERDHKRDSEGIEKAMTSISPYNQTETCDEIRGDSMIDNLTNTPVELLRGESGDQGCCFECAMKDQQHENFENCGQARKERLTVTNRLSCSNTRPQCTCLKRGRNTKLKNQFSSLGSLENIYEVDEPDSPALQQAKSILVLSARDENGNVWGNSKDTNSSYNCVPKDEVSCTCVDEDTIEIMRLHEAVKTGNVNKVEQLLAHGVPVDGLDPKGWTSLYSALESNQTDCAVLLLNCGANSSFKHKDGKTILHRMASIGNYTALEMLLEYDVELNHTDSAGWPALHDALREKRFKCAALLMSSGADLAQYTAKRVQEYTKIVDSANGHKLQICKDVCTPLEKAK